MDGLFNYEENLQTNPLYVKLIEKYELLNEICLNNWICLIPKRTTFTERSLSCHEFLLSHVITESIELPKTHFLNMLGEEIVINGKSLKIKSEPCRVITILFEEIFYTKDSQKFKLLCIDSPVLSKFISKDAISSNHQIVKNLQESIELIQKYGKKQVERKISNAIINFTARIQSTTDYDKIEGNLKLLYEYCVNLTCKSRKMKEEDPFLFMNLKIAIEYILMDTAYYKVFDAISIQTIDESQKFNKTLKKLSNITLEDLGISKSIANERLASLKFELLKIDSFKCALDKISCIKNVIEGISTLSDKKLTVTDEMLPILVYLVIKTSYHHWIPTLKFIKESNLSQIFSAENQSSGSALLYILTTLEAVIFFIQTNENLQLKNNEIIKTVNVDEISSKEDYLQYLFHYIKDNNEIQLTEVLDIPYSAFRNKNKEEAMRSDCHPLCNCEKCEAQGGFEDETSNVNVTSYDKRTMLHVASYYNMPKIVTLLTNHQANVDAQDVHGMSPLHYAASLGYQKILFLLLHAKSNINIKNNKQQTPLILASMNGHEQCVKALLFFAEHTHTSIDMNAQDSDGMTALHHSVLYGFEVIVDILLEYHAKGTLKSTFEKKIPLDYAFNSVIAKKLEDAVKYQVEELPITENEYIFVRSEDLADAFNEEKGDE